MKGTSALISFAAGTHVAVGGLVTSCTASD